jgi:uncharacterized membrane protein YhhN
MIGIALSIIVISNMATYALEKRDAIISNSAFTSSYIAYILKNFFHSLNQIEISKQRLLQSTPNSTFRELLDSIMTF